MVFPQRQTKKYHFDALRNDRPSLCGICCKPVGGLLFYRDDKWFGACSRACQAKLKEGKTLEQMAQLSEKGLEHAIVRAKETYISLSKESNGETLEKPLHAWKREHRRAFFSSLVREYLDYAIAQARNGVDGSNEI